MKKIVFLFYFLILFFTQSVCFSQYFLGEAKKDTYLVIAIDVNEFEYIQLKKGSFVVLSEKKPQNGYFTAVDLETEKFGIINSNDIKVKSSINKTNESNIQSYGYSENYNPTLRIFNNTNVTLNLTVKGTKYTFKPKEKKVVNIKPGKFYYIATSKNVETLYGYYTCDAYHEYTWEFFIVTK